MRFISSFGRWLGKFGASHHKLLLGGVFLLVLTVGFVGSTTSVSAASATEAVYDYADPKMGALLATLASILMTLTSYIGRFALSIIEIIIVPILSYNSYSESPTISLGWSLVRDVVNMFVVLVLLVIAMATIVGYEKIHWQKNLPQFLLAVILVNFSRTICGVLIDISQVVMFTFVNALLDVAAGNFAQLLNFDDFGQYSTTALRDENGASQAIFGAQQLGAAYLLFALYAAMMAILLLLALVFIWRIVVLWILVILSPLAFFTWGVGSAFPSVGSTSKAWWGKFTAALTLGPLLTFFLWLALATGSGNIVEDEGFKLGTSGVGATLVSFETSNLLATFLGLCLLVVGMQQSAATAGSLGGLAEKYMGNKKSGEKIVGAALRLPYQAAGATGKYVDRQGGRLLGADRLSDIATSKTLNYAGKAARAIPIPGVSGVVGRAVANAGGAVQSRIEHAQLAEKKAAKERISKYSDDQLAEHVRLIAKGENSPFSLDVKDDIEAIKVKALTDGDFRKKLKKEVGVQTFEKIMEEAVNMDDGAIKAAGGDADKVTKARNQSIHLLSEKEREKLIQSDKFNARDMSEEAASSEAVRDALKKRYIRTDNNGRDIYAYDEMMKGAYGESLRKAVAGAGLKQVYDKDSADEARKKGDNFTAIGGLDDKKMPLTFSSDDLAASILAGRIKPANLRLEDLQGTNGNALTKALLQTGTSVDRVGGNDATRKEFIDRANSLAGAPGVLGLDVTERVQVDIANLDAGKDASTVFAGATAGSYDVARIERVLEKQPEKVSYFDGLVSGAGANPDVQDAISRSMKVEQVKRLTEQFKNTINIKDKDAIAANVNTISRALEETAARKAAVGKLDKGEVNNYKIVTKSARIVGVTPPKPL